MHDLDLMKKILIIFHLSDKIFLLNGFAGDFYYKNNQLLFLERLWKLRTRRTY